MAFGLTKVEAFGVQREEPLNKRYFQYLVLTITALNTDTDLDIGDYVSGALGTFWDAVDGSEPGDTGLKAIQDIGNRATDFLGVSGDDIENRIRAVAASGATDYAQAVANKAPNLTYDSGNAPTSQTVVLKWLLEDDVGPVEVSASA